jgi:hypothetical protein
VACLKKNIKFTAEIASGKPPKSGGLYLNQGNLGDDPLMEEKYIPG